MLSRAWGGWGETVSHPMNKWCLERLGLTNGAHLGFRVDLEQESRAVALPPAAPRVSTVAAAHGCR